MKFINDESLILATVDGIEDLSPNKYSLSTSNAIVGNGVKLSNGSMTWDSITPITVVLVFDPEDGSGVKHYVSTNGTVYTNTIETGSMPFAITATGISGVTGKIHKLEIYSDTKSLNWIKINYEKEIRYW